MSLADVNKVSIEDAGPPPTYGTDASSSLPTYDEATDMPSDAPPSYSSLFGEIRGAHQSSGSVFEFLKKLLMLLAGTIGCTIAIGVLMAIPIAMIVIGAKYKDDCPIEDKIPIYLIVGGSVGIFKNLLSLCNRARSNDEDGEEKKRNPVESVLDCFLTIWFICGNVWIYKNYKLVHYNTGTYDNRYCDKTLYLFAFWLTTATYIIIGTMCLCVCCVAVCAALLGDD